MTKRAESKYKINRRLGVNLWGRPKSPLSKRDYGPGQHGHLLGPAAVTAATSFAVATTARPTTTCTSEWH